MNKYNNRYFWDENNPRSYNNRMGIYKTNIERDFINNYLPSGQKYNILDVGGGSGRHVMPLLKKNHSVTIIDKSTPAFMLAKERYPSVNYINQDFLTANIRHNLYDLVIAIEVIMYIKNLDFFLLKIHKSLKDNGLLIFTATNINSWRYILRKFRKNRCKYFNEFTPKNYEKVLKKCRFKIITVEGFLWMPFRLNSNNFLIPFFQNFEKILSLNYFIIQSPALLFCAQKI